MYWGIGRLESGRDGVMGRLDFGRPVSGLSRVVPPSPPPTRNSVIKAGVEQRRSSGILTLKRVQAIVN